MLRKNKKVETQKKPRKKKNRLYSLVVTLLAVCIMVMLVVVVFRIQDVKVKGNEIYTSSEIRKQVLNDKASVNSLYVLVKYKIGRGNIPAGADEIKISLLTPWELCIEVKEKERIGYIKKGPEYIYVDKDGTVLQRNNEKADGILCMEGLTVQKADLYQKLEMKESNVFEKMADVCFELKKYDIKAQKIQCKGDRIYAYVGEICISLGNEINSEKLAQVPGILDKLKNEKGILHLENYSEEHNIITFKKDKKIEEN